MPMAFFLFKKVWSHGHFQKEMMFFCFHNENDLSQEKSVLALVCDTAQAATFGETREKKKRIEWAQDTEILPMTVCSNIYACQTAYALYHHLYLYTYYIYIVLLFFICISFQVFGNSEFWDTFV